MTELVTSDTAKRMLERISPVYEEAYVLAAIMQAVGAEFDEVKGRYDELLLQVAPETATWGLKYWEQRYHIPVDENKPLEERRQAVLIKRSLRAPMNPARLEQLASDAIAASVQIVEEMAPDTFGVLFENWDIPPQKIAAMDGLLRRVSPSHLQILYRMTVRPGICPVSAAAGASCAMRTVIYAKEEMEL